MLCKQISGQIFNWKHRNKNIYSKANPLLKLQITFSLLLWKYMITRSTITRPPARPFWTDSSLSLWDRSSGTLLKAMRVLACETWQLPELAWHLTPKPKQVLFFFLPQKFCGNTAKLLRKKNLLGFWTLLFPFNAWKEVWFINAMSYKVRTR